jgi:hypothetical protein
MMKLGKLIVGRLCQTPWLMQSDVPSPGDFVVRLSLRERIEVRAPSIIREALAQ